MRAQGEGRGDGDEEEEREEARDVLLGGRNGRRRRRSRAARIEGAASTVEIRRETPIVSSAVVDAPRDAAQT